MKRAKRMLSLFMALLMILTSFGGAGYAESEPVIIIEDGNFDAPAQAIDEDVSIELSDTGITLYLGETHTLTADVTGASAEDIVWSSTDESVITVKDGVITAVNRGYASVCAKIADVSVKCEVAVKVRLEGLRFSPAVSALQVGRSMVVTASPVPTLASAWTPIAWSSDDESVATVMIDPEVAELGGSTTAIIRALSPGKTMIRLTHGDVISAYELEVVPAPLTEITLAPAEATMYVGENLNLTLTPNENAELGEVEWYSENDAIATVENGIVTGRGKGTARIYAQCGDLKAWCSVTVKVPLTELNMIPEQAELLTGEKLQLSVQPNAGAEMGAVEWSSSDSSVAEVDGGLVTAIGAGQAKITAKYGEFTAVCDLTVYAPLTEITLSAEAKTLQPGDALALNPQPNAGAKLGDMAYESSDEEVAVVEDGVVKAVAPGTAVITVKCGEVTAQCAITVKYAVLVVAPSYSVYVGDALQLNYEYQFADVEALESAVWSVDDESIATIDPETGILTGVSKGDVMVTITITGVNGNTYTVQGPVQVHIRPTGIELSEAVLLMDRNGTEQLYAQLLPEDAFGDIEWESVDPAIAEVTEDGTLIPHALGETQIIARCGDVSAQCTVRVEILPQIVDLYSDAMVVYPGQKGTIRYEIRPLNATVKDVSWVCDDENIATVSADGIVQGVKKGKCTIYGVTANGIEFEIPVEVVDKGKAVTSVKLNTSAKTLERTKTCQLKATVSPSKAADKSIVWASEHPEIAVVDANGVVTALGPGTTRILAAASSGVIKTCTITVVPLKVTKVTLSQTKATMYSGEMMELSAELSPADADETELKWTTSKAAVATVDANGVVTAHAAGTANITCKSVSGKTAVCKVTVKNIAPVLSSAKASVGVGDSIALSVTYQPEPFVDMTLTWTSSKPSVAEVDENGVVTANKIGTAKITCKSQYGATAVCMVTVKAIMPVMDVSKYTLATDESFAIGVTYSPDTLQDMGLIWSSSKSSVADVDENGVVTAYKAGTAKITCKTAKGQTDYCTVTVKDPVPSMDISKATMAVDNTLAIGVTYSPATAQDTGMTWKSSNEAVATVDSDGIVTAVGAGTAKITCTTKHGKTDFCTITVQIPVPKMNISAKTLAPDATLPIAVTYTPATDADTGLVWTSSNEAAALVDENGVVTAIAAGTAKITCTTKHGKAASCTITVKNPAPVMAVSAHTLAPDMAYEIGVTFDPQTPNAMEMTWRSGNESVATVENGVVTGHMPGSAVITCVTKDGLSDSCVITVKNPAPVMAGEKKSLVLGEQFMIEYDFAPVTDSDVEMTWETSDAAVATVDSFGVVTAHALGTAKITCTSQYGDSDTCTVTVMMPVPVFEISKYTLYTGETFVIPMTFNPETSVEVPLEWRTSKPSVATVNAEGVITAISKGTATITGYTEDGKKASCKITVKPMPVSEILLSNPYGDLGVGGKYTLDAVCYPENAANQTLTWKSSNTKIAKVNSKTGEITCLKAGTAVITATAADGSKVKAQIEITVRAVDIGEFKLDIEELILDAGSTRQIELTLLGELNGVKPVWRSDNEKIATVDENGLITAVGSGMTIIRCSVGGKSRIVVVAVPVPGNAKYRFLIAGEYTNSKVSGYLNFAVNGLTNVDAAFDLANIDGTRYMIERLNNPSKSKLMTTISDFFSDATNEDVSVLYLMSHGLNVNGEYRWGIAGSKDYITEKELTGALEKIKGEVVLVMVSCYSGQYVENYTTSDAEASLKGAISTVNGSRPGNKKISVIASQTGSITAAFTDFPKEKSYDFFCTLFSKALGWDQLNATAYEEMMADANNDGKITLHELATYLEDNIQKEIDDHIDQYGEQSVANTAKNKAKQKIEYYLTSPDLVIYSRVQARRNAE